MATMKHFLDTIEIETKHHAHLYDITDDVSMTLKKSEIKNGHVLIQTTHTTTGIYVNENERHLLEDLLIHLDRCAPQQRGRYLHDNISERDCPPDEPLNGHSHIKTALYSNPSVSLVLYQGELVIGQYQRIFLAEFDGPCPRKHKNKRRSLVSIIGE